MGPAKRSRFLPQTRRSVMLPCAYLVTDSSHTRTEHIHALVWPTPSIQAISRHKDRRTQGATSATRGHRSDALQWGTRHASEDGSRNMARRRQLGCTNGACSGVCPAHAVGPSCRVQQLGNRRRQGDSNYSKQGREMALLRMRLDKVHVIYSR